MNHFCGEIHFISKWSIRVEDVENSVDDVGDEVDVAFSSSSSCVHAERLFGSKAEEQQFGVVDVELIRGLPLTCALLQICVVPVWYREIPWGMIYCVKHEGNLCGVCVCGARFYLAKHVAKADSGTCGPHTGSSPLHLVLAFWRAALSHSSRPRASLPRGKER